MGLRTTGKLKRGEHTDEGLPMGENNQRHPGENGLH